MLITSLIFFALALASMVVAVRAYMRIAAAKDKDRAQLRTTTAARREQALAFISYRGVDAELASSCARRLEAAGYDVVKYDPERLWDDPMSEIIRALTTANAIVYVAGTSSDWIKAEIELSETLGLPFFTVHDESDLESQIESIRDASDGIDLEARLGCHHPHDREMLAIKLMGAHTDDIGKDTPRGRYVQDFLRLGEVAGDPGYFLDRIKLIIGAFVFYSTLAIAVVLLIVHLW
jgi:hypothetical protein